MTITTEWKFTADIQAQYTAPNGAAFADVVTSVHWRCIATDDVSGESFSIYGEKPVPRPVDTTAYVDLPTLQGMADADKRAIVLGWIEAVEPGFAAESEAAAAVELEAKLAEPDKSTAAIL